MRRLGLVFLLVAGSATAGEYAVLASGARLRVDRHETDGAKVRLYNAGGMVEMDAAVVRGFEIEEAAPQPEPVTAPVAAPVDTPKPLDPLELADAAADRYGLPRSLVRSVMAAESGLQAKALSPKGAIGLMQLMPGTAQELGIDPWDPAQNVDAGVRYLRLLLEKYDGGLWHALAAYNAGPGAVDKYKGVPPYRETIRYIDSIQRKMEKPPVAR
ncbi:MAG TPA: lytic transglycosylase domain-containing protein [Candidatus Acidoferrum sp.]|nr:lytic transglycosylase domain-containing protein [Candidatus Acidoferrum sp.]